MMTKAKKSKRTTREALREGGWTGQAPSQQLRVHRLHVSWASGDVVGVPCFTPSQVNCFFAFRRLQSR